MNWTEKKSTVLDFVNDLKVGKKIRLSRPDYKVLRDYTDKFEKSMNLNIRFYKQKVIISAI